MAGGARNGLADHVGEAVDEVARFHDAHDQAASTPQRAIDRITGLISRPLFAMLLLGAVALWTGLAVARGGDVTEPVFAWLELAATLGALAVAVIILVTQRREDQLAERRARLTLELALLADRKNAKIIALLEELRRDAPNLADRVDAESDEMTRPADPETVLDAIDERAGGTGPP